MSDVDYDDYDDSECWNCGGEGRVNHCIDGCCVDQDDIYCKYCSRRCYVCHPPTPKQIEEGNKLYLEWSQFTKARTAREIALVKALQSALAQWAMYADMHEREDERLKAAWGGRRMTMAKPILCLDFDGVIHSYSSGWKGADVIPDPPVKGAIAFMLGALHHFQVVIFSSRSHQAGGQTAMKKWLRENAGQAWYESPAGPGIEDVQFVNEKPPAMVTIDDRALTFDGTWPAIEDLKAFQPWNKRPFGATGTFPQGVLNDGDEGALKMGIAFDKQDGLVHLEFGKPVAWTAFPPEVAVNFARSLLKAAGARKVEITL